MKIINLSGNSLEKYLKLQLEYSFPTGDKTEFDLIDKYLPQALSRLEFCIDDIAMWRQGEFDILHSSQYCIFLYYLSNTIWRHEQARSICTKLFLLNKKMNAIDCFYEIEMPDVFFIGHSVGIVLAKATYGNRLVLYQNSTVGKNKGIAPIIENDVVLYPNTAVIGNCIIREGSIISQGVGIIDRHTKGKSLVFQGENGSLVFKQTSRNVLSDYFRSAN